MTETVLRPSQLDAFVRERVDRVLITSCCNSDRLIHVLSDEQWLQPVCDVTVTRGEWLDKSLSIFPPGYHDICPTCVKQRFGVEVMDE